MSKLPHKTTGAQCPLCRKPAKPEYTPFCSQGCKDRDLLQWLGEGYKVPGPDADYADSIDLNDRE